MNIEQTVEIPPSRRLYVDVPPEIPTGKAILTFTPIFAAPVSKEIINAEEIWAYNRTHKEEVAAKLLKLKGSLGKNAFCGLDGIAYQQKVRDEWDE